VVHEHEDRDQLTIGCGACIERVKVDQIVTAIEEWCDYGWEDPGGYEYPDLPELPRPTPTRWRAVYRQLLVRLAQGEAARSAMLQWAIQHNWGPASPNPQVNARCNPLQIV
jgi:hypothetical protein